MSTGWLAEHVADPDVRIVDTRWYLLDRAQGERAYHEGHIPNAVYLHVDRDLAAPPRADARTGRHPLPGAEAFAATMARVGISSARGEIPATHVVAYDDAGGANAARLWWLLRYFGHDTVSLLDGGLQQWQAEARPVSSEVPAFPPGTFHPRPHPAFVVTRAELERLLSNPRLLLLDARARERHAGETEPVDARAGHIPGARNMPVASNLRSAADPRFRDPAALRATYEALGAKQADPIVAYCGSGVNACADLFALYLAGYPNARLYAASYSEWSREPALPIRTGDERG